MPNNIVKKLILSGHKDLAEEVQSILYRIGDKGLSPAETGKILIQPNVEYYFGASSSPSHIIVTKVDNKFIYYYKYPFYKENRIEREIGEDLIINGVSFWLKSYGPDYPKEAEKFKKLMKGEKVPTVDYKDLQSVTIIVKISDPKKTDKDLWEEAAKYGGVGFNRKDNVFEINTRRNAVEEIKKNKNFEFVKVEEDRLSEASVTEANMKSHIDLAKKLVSAGHKDLAKEILVLDRGDRFDFEGDVSVLLHLDPKRFFDTFEDYLKNQKLDPDESDINNIDKDKSIKKFYDRITKEVNELLDEMFRNCTTHFEIDKGFKDKSVRNPDEYNFEVHISVDSVDWGIKYEKDEEGEDIIENKELSDVLDGNEYGKVYDSLYEALAELYEEIKVPKYFEDINWLVWKKEDAGATIEDNEECEGCDEEKLTSAALTVIAKTLLEKKEDELAKEVLSLLETK